MQSFILLGVSIIATVLSQLLFKKGMVLAGDINFSLKNILFLIKYIITNPFLLSGIFLYGVSFILWLMVLSRLKLSMVYPITSLNFILVVAASYFIYNEQLTALQYGGIFLIITGIVLLAKI
jgi:drug/metabolite transporter (DMT)-like permease